MLRDVHLLNASLAIKIVPGAISISLSAVQPENALMLITSREDGSFACLSAVKPQNAPLAISVYPFETTTCVTLSRLTQRAESLGTVVYPL